MIISQPSGASLTTLFRTPAPVYTTSAALVVAGTNHSDIAANTARLELILSNTDSSNSVFVRDQAATTDTTGILLGPKQTLVLLTTAAVRITNANVGAVTVTMNETRSS